MSVTNLGGEQPAMRPKQSTKSCRSEREKKGEKIGLKSREKQNKTPHVLQYITWYSCEYQIHTNFSNTSYQLQPPEAHDMDDDGEMHTKSLVDNLCL